MIHSENSSENQKSLRNSKTSNLNELSVHRMELFLVTVAGVEFSAR